MFLAVKIARVWQSLSVGQRHLFHRAVIQSLLISHRSRLLLAWWLLHWTISAICCGNFQTRLSAQTPRQSENMLHRDNPCSIILHIVLTAPIVWKFFVRNRSFQRWDRSKNNCIMVETPYYTINAICSADRQRLYVIILWSAGINYASATILVYDPAAPGIQGRGEYSCPPCHNVRHGFQVKWWAHAF